MVRALFFFRFGKRQAITLTLHKLRMSPHPFSLCPRVAPALLHRSGERGKRAAPGGEPETQTLSFVAASAVSGVPCSMLDVRCIDPPSPQPSPPGEGGKGAASGDGQGARTHSSAATSAIYDVQCSMFDVPCSMLDVQCWVLDVAVPRGFLMQLW